MDVYDSRNKYDFAADKALAKSLDYLASEGSYDECTGGVDRGKWCALFLNLEEDWAPGKFYILTENDLGFVNYHEYDSAVAVMSEWRRCVERYGYEEEF